MRERPLGKIPPRGRATTSRVFVQIHHGWRIGVEIRSLAAFTEEQAVAIALMDLANDVRQRGINPHDLIAPIEEGGENDEEGAEGPRTGAE